MRFDGWFSSARLVLSRERPSDGVGGLNHYILATPTCLVHGHMTQPPLPSQSQVWVCTCLNAAYCWSYSCIVLVMPLHVDV